MTASLLGRPDVGPLTTTDMASAARRIVSAVDIPVIADADTGYGNAVNVIRTVQEYEAAGVAALHIEDQVAPKRCGHMSGKQVVPADVMVDRVRAAVAARRDPDLVIIARSDAVARRAPTPPSTWSGVTATPARTCGSSTPCPVRATSNGSRPSWPVNPCCSAGATAA